MYTLFVLHVMTNAMFHYFITYIDSIYICNDRRKANKMNESMNECQVCLLDNTILYKVSAIPSLLLILHLIVPSNT